MLTYNFMVAENLAICRRRIQDAAGNGSLSPDDITLVAVTKGVALSLICEAIDSGVGHIGESRVKEAISKFEPVGSYAKSKSKRIVWHMIGHLQTNKAKDAVRLFDLIHSVDSLHLAQEIDRQADKVSKVQDVLLEVNTSREAAKFGFQPEEIYGVVKEAASLKNIRVKGLMTIAPIVDIPERARPYFIKLKELRDGINSRLPSGCHRLDILSMGMTDDFQIAIQEGATMIRIGRGIFGGQGK